MNHVHTIRDVSSKNVPQVQSHLSETERVHLGAYYTEDEYVSKAWNMLESNYAFDGTTILDSACGYGGFIRDEPNNRGYDIDPVAIRRASAAKPKALFRRLNSLENVGRESFAIPEDKKLVIVGNPPFNDRTSLIRRGIKRNQAEMKIDEDLRSRDLGISFLRSFDKLGADAVCVLHPLSYLVKPTNFSALKSFSENYSLAEAHIINSGVFEDNSRMTSFPISIALYLRSETGMTYSDVAGHSFRINDRLSFRIKDFRYVDDFIDKYPRKPKDDDLDGIMFWTLRDINALRRNRTFVTGRSGNAVFINKSQLDYYIYVDVFKQFIDRVPFYLGNSNVMINERLFRKLKKFFVHDSVKRHPYLRKYVDCESDVKDHEATENIERYFKSLLGKHYLRT